LAALALRATALLALLVLRIAVLASAVAAAAFASRVVAAAGVVCGVGHVVAVSGLRAVRHRASREAMDRNGSVEWTGVARGIGFVVPGRSAAGLHELPSDPRRPACATARGAGNFRNPGWVRSRRQWPCEVPRRRQAGRRRAIRDAGKILLPREPTVFGRLGKVLSGKPGVWG